MRRFGWWARLGVLGAILGIGGMTYLYAQRGRSGVFSLDGEFFEPPEGASEDTEYYFARLTYRSDISARWGPRAWMIDSPKAERHFLQGVKRLTGIHTNPMEVYIQVTDPELFNYPWLYAVEPGQWNLNEEEAEILRDYMMRGGTLMVDDFHGTLEWTVFTRSLRKVFPDRPIVEIGGDDPVFHNLYDIDDRFQIPGLQYLYTGQKWEQDGVEPHWRGIYDDHGRLMVIINFDMDLGDAWEHADNPQYPEKWTAAAYRFGINYIVYSMTH